MDDSEIQPIISKKLIKTFNEFYNNILDKIGTKYHLNKSELNDTFKLDSTKIAIELGIKKRNRRVLENTKRCLGRKYDGGQCTRSKRENSPFCLSHEKNLPQGRIDDETYKPKEKGKRGRKKKMHAFSNNPDYISTEKITINNSVYLVDSAKNVYSFNIEKPVYLGIYDALNDTIVKN